MEQGRRKWTKPVLCSILIIALFFVPMYVESTYYRMLFDQALINIIAVIGLNFITGLTGQMNLGMAGIFAVGAYTSALLGTRLGVSPWIGLLCALVMGLLIGVLLGWPSLRIKGIYLALTTIGFQEIIRLLVTNLADLTGGTRGVLNIPQFTVFGHQIQDEGEFYYFLLIAVALLALLAQRVTTSKWGRSFRAIRDNEQAVETVGIDVSRMKIYTFLFSSVYGCVAGALYASLMGYIDPTNFTGELSVKYLMMMMMGGIGSVPGCILGAVTITILPELLRFLKDYYWLIFSTIVLLVSVVCPHGLISLFRLPFAKQRRAVSLKREGGNNAGNLT